MHSDSNEGCSRAGGAPCPAAETLAAFACGELAACEAETVENHIAACAACRGLALELAHTAGRVARWPGRALRRDLLPGILARLEADKQGAGAIPARWRPAWRPALALAAGLAVMYLGSRWISRPGGAPAPAATDEREAAIRGALRWLAMAQKENGAWDPASWEGQPEYETSLTAMALLAFVRGGHSAGAAEERVMRRAAGFLLSAQRDDGGFGPLVPGRMYNHGIATFALTELSARRRDPEVDRALDRAVAFIAARQHYGGGWGYGDAVDDDVNAGTSIWQLLALASARRAGREVPPAVLNRGLLWLRGVIDEGGRVGYRKQGDFPMGSETLTAMGSLCIARVASEIAGLDTVREALEAAVGAAAAQRRADVDFYRSFFFAGALDRAAAQGGDALRGLQAGLAGMSLREGALAGSWEPCDTWSAVGGRVYSTAMAALSLETVAREGG